MITKDIFPNRHWLNIWYISYSYNDMGYGIATQDYYTNRFKASFSPL